MTELRALAETAGADVVGQAITQKMQSPNPGYYIGKGKLEEVQEAVREYHPDLVLFDDELSPSQQRNLEQALKLKVVDRATLILDIFAQRARSREGRLQVNLAQYQYLLPRLSNMWAEFSRTGGGIGTRGGPGEQELERERRRIRKRINDLEGELEDRAPPAPGAPRRAGRAGLPAGVPGGLHQCRQVHPAERFDQRTHAGHERPLRHARPNRAQGETAGRSGDSAIRHRRLHP